MNNLVNQLKEIKKCQQKHDSTDIKTCIQPRGLRFNPSSLDVVNKKNPSSLDVVNKKKIIMNILN